MDGVAERYVTLALAMARHDPDYVDSYYGPPEWKTAADRDSVGLGDIALAADSLVRLLDPPVVGGDSMVVLRRSFLRRHLESLASRARQLAGTVLTYEQEAAALYDISLPVLSDSAMQARAAAFDALLPGRGPLAPRFEALRRKFRVPASRIDTVFRTAVAEARRRTLQRVTLPDSEAFRVEFVRGEPWAAYNWYQGGLRSLIQVNLDLPLHVDNLTEYACHEGYPGHHVYNGLLEQALTRSRGWIEFSIYPLFSPMSLIAEGSAMAATDIAFPGGDRYDFETRVLFPLAGLDTTGYAQYRRAVRAQYELGPVYNEIARRRADGGITRDQAIEMTVRYGALPHAEAVKGVEFGERYRSYGATYYLGKKLVLAWLERGGGDESNPDRRWTLFGELLASPRLPRDLETGGGPATR
jgi:hypothetical protein